MTKPHTMGQKLCLMWHSYDRPGDDEGENPETKFLGVYSPEQAAEAAKAELVTQPGFRDYPDAFTIEQYQVDETVTELER